MTDNYFAIELQDPTIQLLHNDRKAGVDFIHQYFPKFESCQRLHGALTKEMEHYLLTLGTPKEDNNYIEAFYDTSELSDCDYFLMERFDLDTLHATFILREIVSNYSGGNFRILNWRQTNNPELIKQKLEGREPSSFPRAESWETTRYRWNESIKVDYINWGKAGQFGAYAVVTLEDPSPELFDLWTPCAPKHIAVAHMLDRNLFQNALSRNQLLLQLHPPHDGKQGPVTKTYATFPPGKPMSAEECVLMRPLTSSDDEMESDSEQSSE